MIFLHHFSHCRSGDQKPGAVVAHSVEQDRRIAWDRDPTSTSWDFSILLHMCCPQGDINEPTPNDVFLKKVEPGLFTYGNAIIGSPCWLRTSLIERGEFL